MSHPLIGANILKPVAFPWAIMPTVRHHHEHFDGRGYPAGSRGDEIPLLARILTVADSYEAMVADRPVPQWPGSRTTRSRSSSAARETQFDPGCRRRIRRGRRLADACGAGRATRCAVGERTDAAEPRVAPA